MATASGEATGIGSGSATARENIIMAKAMMTLNGVMIALVEEDEVCGGCSLAGG